MPRTIFALLLLAVFLAAAVSVWLISLGGPGVMAIALPVLLIAAFGLRMIR